MNARSRDRLKENLKSHAYALLLARPNDVPAEAVRDFGYQPVVSAKEPYRTLFIVPEGLAAARPSPTSRAGPS